MSLMTRMHLSPAKLFLALTALEKCASLRVEPQRTVSIFTSTDKERVIGTRAQITP